MGAMTKDEVNVSLFDEVKRLQAKVRELERDSKRVEWLLKRCFVNRYGDISLPTGSYSPMSGAEIRRSKDTIDRAILLLEANETGGEG